MRGARGSEGFRRRAFPAPRPPHPPRAWLRGQGRVPLGFTHATAKDPVATYTSERGGLEAGEGGRRGNSPLPPRFARHGSCSRALISCAVCEGPSPRSPHAPQHAALSFTSPPPARPPRTDRPARQGRPDPLRPGFCWPGRVSTKEARGPIPPQDQGREDGFIGRCGIEGLRQ